MIMDAGLHQLQVGVVDVHGAAGGDIDSLLSSSDAADHVGAGSAGAAADGKPRRLLEPYERHRAHDLRAECYRRGIRPIKKGPNANDNKSGYIVLLRKFDGTAGNGLSPEERGSLMGGGHGGGPTHSGGEGEDDTDENDTLDGSHMASLAKKRKLPSPPQHAQQQGHGGQGGLTSAAVAAAAAAAANDLAGFYDTSPSPLVPVLPMQYPNLVKPPTATPTATASDLEILSGIANTYTTQTGNGAAGGSGNGASGAASSGNENGMFCNNCRTIVTDQLMESIRLGRNKMQMIEFQRLMDQRDRDTLHLKETITVLRDLRRSLRDAQNENRLTHELLAEYEDDIAFFRNLKERTKERMRKEMEERAAKQANAGNVGTT